MAINRVLLHLTGCRCQRAAKQQAAVQDVAETIHHIMGDDLVQIFVPTAAELAEFNEPFSFHVKGGGLYDLESLDSAAAEIAEVLAKLAGRYANAAARLQGGAQ
jgi:hypothetical protein